MPEDRSVCEKAFSLMANLMKVPAFKLVTNGVAAAPPQGRTKLPNENGHPKPKIEPREKTKPEVGHGQGGLKPITEENQVYGLKDQPEEENSSSTSPSDVNKKADEFIANFYQQLRKTQSSDSKILRQVVIAPTKVDFPVN
eukprot:Gb_15154 [translate_table: standard]